MKPLILISLAVTMSGILLCSAQGEGGRGGYGGGYGQPGAPGGNGYDGYGGNGGYGGGQGAPGAPGAPGSYDDYDGRPGHGYRARSSANVDFSKSSICLILSSLWFLNKYV